MTNLLQRGAAFLGTKTKSAAVAGRTVRYKHGQLESDDIQGVCDVHDYGTFDSDGIITSFIWYDWTFTTTDLLIRGEQVVPQQGDRILETLNGEERVYEVLPTPEGRRCFEDFDSSNVLILVHTKKIS